MPINRSTGRKVPVASIDEWIARGRQKKAEAAQFKQEQQDIAARVAAAGHNQQGDALEPLNFSVIIRGFDMASQKRQPVRLDQPGAERTDPRRFRKDITKKERPGNVRTAPHRGEIKDYPEPDASTLQTEKMADNLPEMMIDTREAVIETGQNLEKGPSGELFYNRDTTIEKPLTKGRIIAPDNAGRQSRNQNIEAVRGNSPDARHDITEAREPGSEAKAKEMADIGKVRTQDRGEMSNRAGDRVSDGRRMEERKELEQKAREPQKREEQRLAQQIAKQPEELAVEEVREKTPQEKEEERKLEANMVRGIARTSGVIAMTEVASRTLETVQDASNHPTKTQAVREQLQTRNVTMSQPQRSDSMNDLMAGARSRSQGQGVQTMPPGKMLMRSAQITHATGREIHYEAGNDRLQIKKEGRETFAYLNGTKVDMNDATKFMDKMQKELGPQKTLQMEKLIETVARNPMITQENAAKELAGGRDVNMNRGQMDLGRE